MDLKEAYGIIHDVSEPSKMPGYGWSIPAIHCKMGAILAKINGSTCRTCYAKKGRYMFPSTKNAMELRFQSLNDPRWEEAMVVVLSSHRVRSKKFFRWFDSGDLQSVDHLRRIINICRQTPFLAHWLPTRETAFVYEYASNGGGVPTNLTLRLSAPMVDGAAPSWWRWTSGVQRYAAAPKGSLCKAKENGNQCGDCRSCWDPKVRHVSYPWH